MLSVNIQLMSRVTTYCDVKCNSAGLQCFFMLLALSSCNVNCSLVYCKF